MTRHLQIVHEDGELLVLNKPAGLVCHPTKGDEFSSLISRIRLHLGPAGHPHLINRLDRETSGVVIAAKTDDAARTLRKAWEGREVHKEYWAIAQGHLQPDAGQVDAPLGKATASRVAIKDCVRPDGLPARTRFEVLRRFERAGRPFSMLRVVPETGRKHQIRIHLAHLGHPVVGDKIYGDDEQLYLHFVSRTLSDAQWDQLILPHQALHARAVRFAWHGGQIEFSAPPEPWFIDFAGLSAPG